MMSSSEIRAQDAVPTYRSISVTRRGGPEAIEIVERELRPPNPGEARIRVLATPVVQDDVAVRIGNRPFLRKPPFTPGYSLVGEVDAIGEGVGEVRVGDRVAALTQFGGHAEMAYWPSAELVQVPEHLDPAEAVVLILNYLVPYQILHRVAKVEPGDSALIVGASGGVGTAFLQLGKLAGLKMYGLASASKHTVLRQYGATGIDYHDQDFVAIIRRSEPDGLDFVFNGMDQDYFGPSMAVLGKGGVLVHYGGPQSMLNFLRLMLKFVYYNLLPNGKRIEGYGTHRLGVDLFKPDWTALFALLAAGEVQPIVAAKYPLVEARAANELLERGEVIGTIVLVPS
jgi:NADPH:quinone reductase-like Zn-dependent oxidoreductase